MGRFCKFCGNPVEDGKECGCEGAVNERQELAAKDVLDTVSTAEETPVNTEVNSNSEAVINSDASADETVNPIEEAPVNTKADSTPEITPNSESNVNETASTKETEVNNTPVNDAVSVQETPVNNAVTNVAVPVQNSGNAGQTVNAAGKSLNIDVAKILTDVLGLTKSLFKNPFEALKSSFADVNKQSQLVAGGISAFVMFVLFIIIFNNPLFGAFTTFKIAFGLILSYIFVKAVYSLGGFVFAKKQTKPVSYLSVLGLCSLTTIFDMIIIFLAVIFSSISLGLLSSICLAFMLVNNIISAVVIAYIAFEENFVKTYRVSLLLQLILVCIVMLLLQAVANSILSSIFSGMPGGMNGLNMFGNIY